MSNEDICGYQGDGRDKPCQRTSGWGIPKEQANPKGRCKDHGKHADEKKKQEAMEVAKILEEKVISVGNACNEVGISRPTLHRRREKYPEVDKKVEQAIEKQRQSRADALEDAAFKQLINGGRGDSLMKYMLSNYRPETFKDKKEFEHSGDGVAQIVVSHDLVEQKEEKEEEG